MREYTVYVHKNLKNDKYYVGMTSQNPKERWDSGWGYKYNKSMWKDIQESNWNNDWVHGILGKFENKQDALKYESFLIAMLDSVRNGYNTSGYSSHHCKHLETTKKKIAESMTGEKNPMYGMTGEKNPFYGKTHTEETRRKISQSKGVYGILQYSKNGELIAEYSSISEAEKKTGCDNICDCCKGKRKSCGGYIWKYKNGGLN